MHPAFIWYWKRQRYGWGDPCAAAWDACNGRGGARRRHDTREGVRLSGRRGRVGEEEDLLFGVGSLGVRRPLRFLASRLDLDDDQFAQAAKILEELKIERAQAAVDLRRSSAELAEALEASEFAQEHAQSARARRVDAAGRVQDAISAALAQLHALLDADQRAELATLIRSGALRL